jgi:uncharacterized protein (DUF58 family)
LNPDNQKVSPLAQAKRRLGQTVPERPAMFRLTSVGLGVVMITLMIIAAAFNTGTNLLYMIVATLLSFCTVSLIYGRMNIARLEVRRRLPSEVFAGEKTDYELELKNRKRWLSSYGIGLIETAEQLAGQTLNAFFLSAAPGQSATRTVEIVFPRRGLVRMERLLVASCFPFGFVEFRTRKKLSSEALVYPKLLPVESILRLQGPDLGEREMGLRGHGVSLFAIRDYQAGDPARSIHWKLSSKGTGIKTREYEREESKTILLILDFTLPPEPSEEDLERFERAVSATASLAKYFLDHGHEAALWTPAGTISKGIGPHHLRRILRSLALVEADQFKGDYEYPRPGPEVTEVWISSRGGEKDAVRGGDGRWRIDPEALAAAATTDS